MVLERGECDQFGTEMVAVDAVSRPRSHLKCLVGPTSWDERIARSILGFAIDRATAQTNRMQSSRLAKVFKVVLLQQYPAKRADLGDGVGWNSSHERIYCT
jgi:hypothetical protein